MISYRMSLSIGTSLIFLMAIMFALSSSASYFQESQNLRQQSIVGLKRPKGFGKPMLDAKGVIALLKLVPLPNEGGFFRETYRSPLVVGNLMSNGVTLKDRRAATAIYYMITPEAFSTLHKLPQDEIFHFYLGQPVEMLIIDRDGNHQIVTLGTDLRNGNRPQVVVPGGNWQGARLVEGVAGYALLGTSVSPGFEFQDMELASRAQLLNMFPEKRALIEKVHG